MRAGDVALLRTGQVRVYPAGDRHGYGHPSPGLSVRCPVTCEIFPPEIENLWLPVHALHLVEMGMPQGQNWNLEELSTVCGETGRCAFPLSAMPEPFVGATGTSVAPVAVL